MDRAELELRGWTVREFNDHTDYGIVKHVFYSRPGWGVEILEDEAVACESYKDAAIAAAVKAAFVRCAEIAEAVQPREHAMGYEARVKADIAARIRSAAP